MEEKTWPTDGDRLMGLSEVAYRLDTSPHRVSELVNAGLLPVIRIGVNKKVRKVRVEEFLEAHEGEDLLELLGKEATAV